MIGGSRDIELNEAQVIPRLSEPLLQVTTITGNGTLRIVVRKSMV
jgi:hypothetical protein